MENLPSCTIVLEPLLLKVDDVGSLIYWKSITYFVVVTVDSKVWVLDRKVFQQIMVRTGLQRLQDNINFLRSVPLLQNLSNEVLAKIADVLEVVSIAFV